MIKIYDYRGHFSVLNPSYIIRIRRCEPHSGYGDAKTVIEYGSGFLEVIFLNEDVQEVFEYIEQQRFEYYEDVESS